MARYYISSADLTAEKFVTAIRNHWHVENKLHWHLDVVMNEDDCKVRRGNAAGLFSGIRHIAINILTRDKVFKAGLRRKMRKAAMDRNYLASVHAGSWLSLSCPDGPGIKYPLLAVTRASPDPVTSLPEHSRQGELIMPGLAGQHPIIRGTNKVTGVFHRGGNKRNIGGAESCRHIVDFICSLDMNNLFDTIF